MKKGYASVHQVHAGTFDIDDKFSNPLSVHFDVDFITVICNNRANVCVCNPRGCFLSVSDG